MNGKDSWNDYPVASTKNIQRALNQIGDHMNVEEDILLLSLISHGDTDTLQLDNPEVDIESLDAEWLKETLDETGIRWRVIVISACYSGSFIDDLKTPYTMVITAAHADRSSFGCGNDNKYTYFGRAFFVNALPNSNSLQEAFALANKEVRLREAKLGHRPSRPQIFIGKEIEKNIATFEQHLF